MTFKYSRCKQAAAAGDLQELTRMHEAGFPWDEETTWRAAQYGHVDCLRYAVEHGCPLETQNCLTIPILIAAQYGNLACLKYLHSIGSSFRETAGLVCTIASQNRHLDCLQFAHENGYPWDEDTIRRTGDLECITYAITHGCPYNTEDLIRYFSERIYIQYDFDMFPWIRDFLFSLLDTNFLHATNYPQLYDACKEKLRKIKVQREQTIKHMQEFCPFDVINHCILPYY